MLKFTFIFQLKHPMQGNDVQMQMFCIFKEYKVNKLVLTQTVQLCW